MVAMFDGLVTSSMIYDNDQFRDFIELSISHSINISHIQFAWGQIPVRSQSKLPLLGMRVAIGILRLIPN